MTGQWWLPGAVTQVHCIVRSEVFLTSVAVRCLFCGVILVALVRRKGMGWWSIAAYLSYKLYIKVL